jgi:hypothetical protein
MSARLFRVSGRNMRYLHEIDTLGRCVGDQLRYPNALTTSTAFSSRGVIDGRRGGDGLTFCSGKSKFTCAAPFLLNSVSSCGEGVPITWRRDDASESPSPARPVRPLTDLMYAVYLVQLVGAGKQRVQRRNLKKNTSSSPQIHLGAVEAVRQQALGRTIPVHHIAGSALPSAPETHGVTSEWRYIQCTVVWSKCHDRTQSPRASGLVPSLTCERSTGGAD